MEAIAHCCCLERKAAGAIVVMDRGFAATNAVEGDEAMARVTDRRRRYLVHALASDYAFDGWYRMVIYVHDDIYTVEGGVVRKKFRHENNF